MRGGPRRVAADGATELRPVLVKLDPQSIETLRAYGDGNLSAGVRAAARAVARKTKPKQ